MRRHLALALALALSGCGQAPAPGDKPSATTRAAELQRTSAIDAFVHAGRTPLAYRDLSIALREHAPDSPEETERRLVSLALFPVSQISDTSPDAQVQSLALTVWPTLLAPPDVPIDADVWPRTDEDEWAYLERMCREDRELRCATVVPEFRAQVVAAAVADRALSRVKRAIASCVDCRDEGWRKVRRGWEGVARTAAAGLAEVDHRSRVAMWPLAGAAASHEDLAPDVEIEIGPASELAFDGYRFDSSFRLPILRDARRKGSVAFHMQPEAPVRQLAELLRDARVAGFATISLIAREPTYPWGRRAYALSTSDAVVRTALPLQAFLRELDAGTTAMAACRALARAGSADHAASMPGSRTGSPASC